MSAAHDKAKAKFIKTWEKIHGFTPRTFPLDDMTTAEIDEMTAEEIAEQAEKESANKT